MHSGLKYLIGTYRPLKGWAAVWVYGALGIGIAAMVMLFRFSHRVEGTVHKDARKFLAADFQIQARRKPTEKVYAAAQIIAGGVDHLALQTDLLASAILPEGDSLTVSLRALENNLYPFYGTFGLSPSRNVEDLRKDGHGVFVDASMRERGLKLGDVVTLGSIKAKVLAYIEEEPQSVASAFAVGPRFIVHQEALRDSKLADYGAYAFYSLLIKSSFKLTEAQKILKTEVGEPHWRLISPQRANLQTQRVVSRLESFLMLIAFAAFVLGGVGLFAIARFQILRNLSDWILFKALGLTRSDLLKFSVFWISLVALVSLAIGFGLGYLLEESLAVFAQKSLAIDLAPLSAWVALPHAIALAFGASILALGLPLLQVTSVSPNRAWASTKTKSIDASARMEAWIFGGGVTLLLALTTFGVVAKSWLVALLWALATWLGAFGIKTLSRVWVKRHTSVLKQYPYLWIHRSWSELRVLNYSIAAAIYLMVLVAVIASTLRGQLQLGRADSAPQAVALGVLEDQKSSFVLPANTDVKWVPTLQLRVTSIKGEAVRASEFNDEGEIAEEDNQRSSFSLSREYVVSPRDTLEHNESLVGEGLLPGNLYAKDLLASGGLRLSLESEFAGRLGVVPGDSMTVNIAGVDLPARVDSLRRVQWFRFQPSFFMLVSPVDLVGAPLNYVGLFSRVENLRTLQKDLQTQFPNVAVIDSKTLALRLVTLINRVIFAISSLGVFVLLAASWVYVAVLVSRRPAFRQDLYLVRLLGSNAPSLRAIAVRHFAFLTVGTGLIAGALAILSAWLLAHFLFEISLAWPAAGLALASSAGISILFSLLGYALSGPYANWQGEAEDFAWQPG